MKIVIMLAAVEAELPNLENWSFADLRNPLMSSRKEGGEIFNRKCKSWIIEDFGGTKT